jgi:3-deoxy-manno-octulosonate cytidylyltransferase (CMP-KDO synthetase)
MSTAILIPARLNSSRFPNKMLANLNGKPLVRYVYDKCAATGFDTYVITPDILIADVVPNSIIVGDADNGTERCMMVIDEQLHYDRYINVQGDMPDITVDIIQAVEKKLQDADVSTAYTKMDINQRQNPNTVKLIHSQDRAHWFCRAALPYGDHHLGIYGYNRESKITYTTSKKFIEEYIEKLEQLRWLQNDVKISVVEVEFNGIEINTPTDLEEWQRRKDSGYHIWT